MNYGKVAPAFYIEEKWETVVIAIKAGIPVGGPLWNYMMAERLQDNFGSDQRECDRIEGWRRGLHILMDIAASKDE